MKFRLVLPCLLLSLGSVVFANPNPTLTPGRFDFRYFDINGTPPGLATLSVEHISDTGSIVGAVTPPAVSPTSGWVRDHDGEVTTIADPNNTGPFVYTLSNGINAQGTVVGYYYDTANAQYSGFFYQKGTYTTYNVPGLPAFSATTILAINEFGAFCGYYQPAPVYNTVPYCNWFGTLDTNFSIPGATFIEPESVNDRGEVSGSFYDGKQYHGFFRDKHGNITTIDVPGAAFSGTVVIGLNNFGWTSGHFWDSGNHEHGFVRSPRGHFYQVDVPGAETVTAGAGTAGGGINDFGVFVGHFDPAGGGADRGFIARPDFDEEED